MRKFARPKTYNETAEAAAAQQGKARATFDVLNAYADMAVESQRWDRPLTPSEGAKP